MLQLTGRVWNLDPTSRKGVSQGISCVASINLSVLAVPLKSWLEKLDCDSRFEAGQDAGGLRQLLSLGLQPAVRLRSCAPTGP